MDVSKFPKLGSSLAEVASSSYVTLYADETIAEALKRLRSDELGERIVYFYVVDEKSAADRCRADAQAAFFGGE